MLLSRFLPSIVVSRRELIQLIHLQILVLSCEVTTLLHLLFLLFGYLQTSTLLTRVSNNRHYKIISADYLHSLRAARPQLQFPVIIYSIFVNGWFSLVEVDFTFSEL